MKKIKWFDAEWPISLKTIASRMLERQYNDRNGEGFLLSKNSNICIEGRYIKKIFIKNEVIDPFGDKSEIENIDYNIVNFRVRDEKYTSIEISDYPSLVKPFVENLRTICGPHMSISNVTIDPQKWLKVLETKLGKLEVHRVECSGINVANIGMAKVIFNSTQDIRNGSKEFLGKRYYVVDNIHCSLSTPIYKGKIELSKRGAAKYSVNCKRFVLPALRETISSVVRD